MRVTPEQGRLRRRLRQAREALYLGVRLPAAALVPRRAHARAIRAASTETAESSLLLRNSYKLQPAASAAAGRDPRSERYIVSADIARLFSGLGCLLFILGPAWAYARSTGRTLVIDWRGDPYTRAEPDRNLFPLLFEPPDPAEIGVACIADDSVADLLLPQPVLGPEGSLVQESGEAHALPTGGLDEWSARRVMVAARDVDAPTFIPSLETTYFVAANYGPMGPYRPKAFSWRDGRRLYGSLHLRPEWATVISDFHERYMAEGPVIGVHVRHGNGEGRSRHHFQGREIEDLGSFADAVADKVRRFASSRSGDRYTVFLCTDSDEVVEAMKSRLPSLVTRRVWRPPAGAGVDFDHAYARPDGGVGAAADALIDMRLLARCDAVLLTTWTGFASHVPYLLDRPGAVFLDHEQTARI